ncbi:hypothetical protein F4821DRAFT_251189 [Hypoxylon rubiginosum]|uniref:Uncharacterized protein n=1 Tax=Hypoxylon rubiginosum TaxID=110542 RepID=A0ACC0CJL3_9PEZI|nr:hypothetical protein F4821DRAFT_251189 [Hypoxylon rubiginosum]
MEHLILPRNPRHPVQKVALLSAEEYDGLDFLTYPGRQGWRERTIDEWFAVFRCPTQYPHFVSFLERWLLFGVISVFCDYFQIKFTPSDFIGLKDGVDPIFTTQHLPNLLRQMADRGPGSTNDLLASILSSPEDAAEQATVIVSSSFLTRYPHLLLIVPSDKDAGEYDKSQTLQLYDFITTFGYSIKDPRQAGIAMATSIMHETLQALVNRRAGPTRQGSLKDSNGLMEKKLREDSWCPSDFARFRDQFNTSGLYFIYQSPRQRPDEMHHDTLSQARLRNLLPSRQCTPFICTNRQISDSTYRTKHASDSCNCNDTVTANPDELCKILELGQIPLILILEENDRCPDITFVGYSPEDGDALPYVAISHVWSDGLGNVNENSLPRCQLRRLSELVKALPGKYSKTSLFWCDTICVPTDEAAKSSARMQNAQGLAMKEMRNVYSKGVTCLVLDSWLWNNSTEDKSNTEILMEIFTCPWNTRLWTYQEGALPESLHFQFMNEAYNLDAGMAEANKCTNLIESISLLDSVRARYESLRGFRQKQTSSERLGFIAAELGYRMTSVAADEALCLAVLLDLDVEKIVNTKDQLRMQELWRMIRTIPRNLVFTRLETLSADGLRWAPATFLKSPHNISSQGYPVAEDWSSDDLFITKTEEEKDGIYLRDVGIIFPPHLGRFASPFYLRDEKHMYCLVYAGRKETIDIISHARFQYLALIIDCGSERYTEGYNIAAWVASESTDQVLFNSVLVGVVEWGDTIHCERIQHCVVVRYGKTSTDAKIRQVEEELLPSQWKFGSAARDLESRCQATDGVVLQDQHWYIG